MSKDLTLTLLPMKCRHPGCNSQSTVFGFCNRHEGEAIQNEFNWMVGNGMAEEQTPACFDSDVEWREYAVSFLLASRAMNGSVPKVEYCRDCTPKRKAQMIAGGRCAHPETVFIQSDRHRDVIGVALTDRRKPDAWEKAMMGISGPVVALPSSEVIDAVVEELSQSKKPGRPRKSAV